MNDLIDRQDAIDALSTPHGILYPIRTIEELPSAQQDCTECPKYCDVIRQTLKEAQPERTGRWIDYTEDGYVECPFCHSATNCDDNISDLHFCFSCGARLEGES